MPDGPFQTAWIIGASTGIGAELAKRLVADGCRVAVSARGADRLRQLAETEEGDKIVPVPVDVTEPASVSAGFSDVTTAFSGTPDLVVISAGFFEPMKAADFSADLFRKHVDVNLMGVAQVLDVVLPSMLKAGRGQIAIVGSVSGYRGLPKAVAYGATKAALINMAESLRVELAPKNLVVQVVNPGFVDTPMTESNDFPMPHLMPVDKAVDAFMRGLKSGQFEITFPKRFTWQLKLLRILPYWLYFPLIRRATRSTKT